MLDLHVTSNSAEPSWAILHNPLSHTETPIELRVCKFQHFDLFQIQRPVTQVVDAVTFCKDRHWVLDCRNKQNPVSFSLRYYSVLDDGDQLQPNSKELAKLRLGLTLLLKFPEVLIQLVHLSNQGLKLFRATLVFSKRHLKCMQLCQHWICSSILGIPKCIPLE